MTAKTDKSMSWLLLLPIVGFCLIGLFLGSISGNAVAGIFWGGGIGIAVTVVSFISIFGWDWLKSEMTKGKLFPYIAVAIIVAIAISGYFAFTLGKASCEEYDDTAPRSSCIQYADNGFEATSEQRWGEFWSKFPVTVIITSLIATLVHHNVHKKKE